jgi:hypothetical protein
MYGKIRFVQNIHHKLQYQENKLAKGQAECIHAGNFIKDLPDLSFEDKQVHFERLYARNERAQKTTAHIILSFHHEDQLSNEKLKAVVQDYLTQMQLEPRPYLVYRHHDTYHPHVHVLYAAIRDDGKKIKLHRMELHQYQQAMKQLEEKHSLTAVPETHAKAHRISYGETPLYASMSKVLETVVPAYKYTSLEELNAVLRLYNIQAEKANKGLIYRALDDEGRAQAAYIKASQFESKPTLKHLEERFTANQSQQDKQRINLTSPIDWALNNNSLSYVAFVRHLAEEQISVVPAQNKKGVLQDLYFVDHESKTVFKGSALGESYTAEAIRKRCVSEEVYTQLQQQELAERQSHRLSHSW